MLDFSFLQEEQILTDPKDCEIYGRDRSNLLHSLPKAVLFPKSTQDVSAILSYCDKHNIAVVPSGGRTGLSAAATTPNHEVLISLEKMNRILSVDPVGATIEVEAGVILENIQNEVEKHDLYFPLDFAAKGSCLIGGCISTNAGGVKVIKYGMTRNSVLGLEIVKANGDVLDLNRSLVKDNSGYDLKQLFIGAEGTLGIITKATLKCVQKARNPLSSYLAVERFEEIPKLFSLAKKKSIDLLAFEFLTEKSVDAVEAAMPQLKLPFQEKHAFLVLMESDESEEKIEQFLDEAFQKEYLTDAVIAQNSEMNKNFWFLREAVSDSLYLLGTVYANDISVPIKSLSPFLNDLEELIQTDYTKFSLGLFGHIGDGNFHVYIIDTEKRDFSLIKKDMLQLDAKMFALVQSYHGSISAEHGIGMLKKASLHFRRSEREIDFMRQMKRLFDPNGILNPNKVFNMEKL